MRVAAIQMQVGTDVAANVESICGALREAASTKAVALLTPEGALSGYTHQFDPHEVAEALEEVTAYAANANVGLALGTCLVEQDGLLYNELRFYDRAGSFLGFHSKILRCGTMTEPSRGEIEHYATSPLRTFELDGVRVGGLICNDMWANPACTPMPDPHLSQQLASRGARVVLHAVNGGRDGTEWSREVNFRYHEANLRMRARSGSVWVVTVDSCSPIDLACSAPSGVVDPRGNWACAVDHRGEQFFAHTIPV